MSEEHKPEESIQEGSPSPKRSHIHQQQSAMRYIAILFAAAFVLMFLTFLMERRQAQAILQENLQESSSAVQTLKNLFEENEALKQQIAALESDNHRLETDNNTLHGYVTNLELSLDNARKGLYAMDWFWQIDEAYVKGRYPLCRSLIETLDAAGLTKYLPTESITDNKRFSPADRLEEIRNLVF